MRKKTEISAHFKGEHDIFRDVIVENELLHGVRATQVDVYLKFRFIFRCTRFFRRLKLDFILKIVIKKYLVSRGRGHVQVADVWVHKQWVVILKFVSSWRK